MDHESFDRLAVLAGRLKETKSRRGALALLLGGLLGGSAATAEAKNKNHNKRCVGYGQVCDNHRKCCQGRCRYGRCYPGGGGGGGGGNDNWWGNCRPYGSYCTNNGQCCNGRCRYNVCINDYWDGSGCGPSGYDCPAGTRCCNLNGYKACCVDDGHHDDWRSCGRDNYWGYNGTCPSGFRCCNGNWGGGCCPSGMSCCNNGQCCPSAMRCTNQGCMPYYSSRGTGDAGTEGEEISAFPRVGVTPAADSGEDAAD